MKVDRARGCAFLLLLFLFSDNLQVGFSKTKKLPDLTVSNLSSDTSTTVGTRLQNVVATIVNQGKRPSGPFRVRFYLSSDTDITADDIDTGSGCDFPGLSRGESLLCSEDIEVPASLTPGPYYLGAIVDDLATITEKNEGNNYRAFGPLMINAEDNGVPPPPKGAIQIDGDPADWAGIHPNITDSAGDGPFDSSGRYVAGSDFLSISITNDNTNVYFLMEFAGTPYTGGIALFLDTDVNPVTGCNGVELAIHSSSSESAAHLALADYRDCFLSDDFPEAVVSAVQEHENHSFVEASIRIEDLFRLTPGRRDFRFYARADASGTPDYVRPATVYSLTSHFPGGSNLQIAFDSESVSPDFSGSCGTSTPGWRYAMTLTETGGVGVTITSYKTVLYDANGGYEYTIGVNSGEEFARLFGDCGAGSNHIGPNGKVCGRSLCLDIGGRSGGQIDMTFSGTDDKGNQVRFTSGRLILAGR